MCRLSVDDLGHRFGRRVLFRGLSFEMAGGTSVAVTGSNGSGKSTLLRILAGVLRPRKGEVELQVNGASVDAEERPLHTGLVAPYLNVYDGLTARENLQFLAKARQLPNAETRMQAVLNQVDLASRADDAVAEYSSGMKQRVKFAAALLAAPPLLLLDEPTVTLDAAGRAMVDAVKAAQVDAGRLLVVATNIANEAATCDRTISVEDFRR